VPSLPGSLRLHRERGGQIDDGVAGREREREMTGAMRVVRRKEETQSGARCYSRRHLGSIEPPGTNGEYLTGTLGTPVSPSLRQSQRHLHSLGHHPYSSLYSPSLALSPSLAAGMSHESRDHTVASPDLGMNWEQGQANK
jgi:hypothetical protein